MKRERINMPLIEAVACAQNAPLTSPTTKPTLSSCERPYIVLFAEPARSGTTVSYLHCFQRRGAQFLQSFQLNPLTHCGTARLFVPDLLQVLSNCIVRT